MNQLYNTGIFAIVAITAITLFVLYALPATTTGNFVSTGSQIQYTPREACEVKGCSWTGQLVGGIERLPSREPIAVCQCGAELRYAHLIDNMY